MAVTSKWRQHKHIEAWQRSGRLQTAYCAEQQINFRTFLARPSEYRKLPASVSATLIPVQIAPSGRVDAVVVFTHTQGHRLSLPASVSANWVAEMLQCPA